jgi:type II secretory pathway pseudopilin PulG
MNKRVYGAFTLVEMLVVMGILIILMVIGIAAGSFALNRASDVAHRNAADQLYEGLQAYYVDHMNYPKPTDCKDESGASVTCTPASLMTDPDILGEYMDLGAFNGGSGATYMYFVGGPNDDQAVLVCVTMRGDWPTNVARDDGAVYCAGNGFNAGVKDATGTEITLDTPLIEKSDDPNSPWQLYFASPTNPYTSTSDWQDGAWVVTP